MKYEFDMIKYIYMDFIKYKHDLDFIIKAYLADTDFSTFFKLGCLLEKYKNDKTY